MKGRLTVGLADKTTPEETAEIIAAIATAYADLADAPIEDLLIVQPDRWTLWFEGPVPTLPPRRPHSP